MVNMCFNLAGESFEVVHFPHLYRMYQVDPVNTENQLRSIADAWHEGSIISAAVAFESDFAHG